MLFPLLGQGRASNCSHMRPFREMRWAVKSTIETTFEGQTCFLENVQDATPFSGQWQLANVMHCSLAIAKKNRARLACLPRSPTAVGIVVRKAPTIKQRDTALNVSL
jgi:hypothetical protein